MDFDSLLIGHEPREKDFDAVAWTQEDERARETLIEFEVYSKNFEREGHRTKKHVLVICWEDDWKDRPENIDILELKQFWEIQEKKHAKK